MNSFAEYIRPTYLCDFDQAPEIGNTAGRLIENLVDKRQRLKRLYLFVKELPYGLEDWDVKASGTLRKGWGMCAGKTNLLVAMARALEIPARYRIFKIETERTLWHWLAEQDSELASKLRVPFPEQDHIVAEVYLDRWETYDPSRDTAFAEGLKRLGIPLGRKPITGPDGNPQLRILASIDEWARNRQQARRFREDRQPIFSRINEQFDRIRSFF